MSEYKGRWVMLLFWTPGKRDQKELWVLQELAGQYEGVAFISIAHKYVGNLDPYYKNMPFDIVPAYVSPGTNTSLGNLHYVLVNPEGKVVYVSPSGVYYHAFSLSRILSKYQSSD